MNAQVDPRDLTAAELSALRLVARNRLWRARNGWRGTNRVVVTLHMAERLTGRGLVIRQYDAPKGYRLALTGVGVNTLAVAEQRRKAA
jgi:hypothetical protein